LNVNPCLLCSKKDESIKDDSVKERAHKEDYIDENPELQKILRDLYSEPENEIGLFSL
jgi:hypothetical protein